MTRTQISYPRTVEEFRKMLGSDEACIDYLIQNRWPDGFFCPDCDNDSFWVRNGRLLLICKRCRKNIYPLAGTLMHGSHMPLHKWFWAAYLISTLTPGISAHQLQRQLGLGSYRTAWYMLGRLRKGMVNDKRSRLQGVVEADETIIGGPSKNNRGRGTVDDSHKSLVAGAVEVISYIDKKGDQKEKAGRLRLSLIQHADEKTIKRFLNDNLEKSSIVRTDGWRGYSTTALKGYIHNAQVQHSSLKAHQLSPHIHRAFSNLKTWLTGIHHGVEPKYLQGYLDEYIFRYNRRQNPMAAFQTLLVIALGKSHSSLKIFKEVASSA